MALFEVQTGALVAVEEVRSFGDAKYLAPGLRFGVGENILIHDVQ